MSTKAGDIEDELLDYEGDDYYDDTTTTTTTTAATTSSSRTRNHDRGGSSSSSNANGSGSDTNNLKEESGHSSHGNGTNNQVKGSYAALTTSSFKDFMLKKELDRAIGDAGFEHPSEVQHEAIPKAMLGSDMIVQAKSGMGKTAVFVLATLSQIEPKVGIVDTLVLCHTREMAFQVASEFERFGKYMPQVVTGLVYGGVPFSESKREIELKKPHVLIGTPGRLVHLIEKKVLNLDGLSRFIVDECDEMLVEIPMRRQVQRIFMSTPHTKQVMMFSATISKVAAKVCRQFTKKAKEIFVDDKQLTLHGLQQHFVKVEERGKNRRLNSLLDALDFNQVVIFVRSKQRASELNRLLTQCGFPSICVHGDMPQKKRLRLFQEFKEYKHRILVGTNLFGRGVDIERVNIVINYDMPKDATEYLHRVGRAGRFGTKGLAVTFVALEKEDVTLKEIQDKFKVKITPLPDEVDTAAYM